MPNQKSKGKREAAVEVEFILVKSKQLGKAKLRPRPVTSSQSVSPEKEASSSKPAMPPPTHRSILPNSHIQTSINFFEDEGSFVDQLDPGPFFEEELVNKDLSIPLKKKRGKV
jgi:hypothetical protein